MSQEELKDTEENLKWLANLVPTLPSLSLIEPTVQSLAIIGFQNKYTNDEMIVIGVAGFLTARARSSDETRFELISPHEYIHHAYVLLKMFKKEVPNETEFLGILGKII